MLLRAVHSGECVSVCSPCARKLLVSSSDWEGTLGVELFTEPKTQQWITNKAPLDTESTGRGPGALKELRLPIIKRQPFSDCFLKLASKGCLM